MTIRGLLEKNAAERPERNALVWCEDKVWCRRSWREHLARVRDIAEGYGTRFNLKPRVENAAIVLGNSPVWLESYLAQSGAGVSVVPLDPKLHEAEVEYILADSEAVVVTTDVHHLKAEPIILKYIRDQHWANPIVVAPDTGGAKTAYGYSRKLGCGLAIVAKQRTGDSTVDAFSVVGDVKDHDVIMIDDMTATGGTLSAAAKMCREDGAKTVHAFVSHFPLTEKGVERLQTETQLDELVVTDTIPLRAGFDPSKLPFKLTQLSVAPLIGEAIRRTHNDESINDLFNHE